MDSLGQKEGEGKHQTSAGVGQRLRVILFYFLFSFVPFRIGNIKFSLEIFLDNSETLKKRLDLAKECCLWACCAFRAALRFCCEMTLMGSFR